MQRSSNKENKPLPGAFKTSNLSQLQDFTLVKYFDKNTPIKVRFCC